MAVSGSLSGSQLIAEERERQVSGEGYTVEHDDQHTMGELALAALAYGAPRPVYVMESHQRGVFFRDPWIWDVQYDKRREHSRKRRLVIAGALIAAEIDRVTRIEQRIADINALLESEAFLPPTPTRKKIENDLLAEHQRLTDLIA